MVSLFGLTCFGFYLLEFRFGILLFLGSENGGGMVGMDKFLDEEILGIFVSFFNSFKFLLFFLLFFVEGE